MRRSKREVVITNPDRGKKRPKGRGPTRYMLTVFYQLPKVFRGFTKDAAIIRAVGRHEDGAGTELRTMMRDIDFSFATKAAADNARTRVRRIAGVKTKIHGYKQ